MSDFRIQRAINAATNTTKTVMDKAYKEKRQISKSGLIAELMTVHPISPRAAEQIVKIVSSQHFTEEDGVLIPHNLKR